MNPEPKRGERRADGKYFLGLGGLEWVKRQTFRDAANAQLRASGNCSYEWKAALSLQARTRAKVVKIQRLEKKRGMNAADWKKKRGREYAAKSLSKMTDAERLTKQRACAARSLARQRAFSLEARAYLAAKKKAREATL